MHETLAVRRAVFALHVLVVVFATEFVPAFAADLSSGAVNKGNPRLASLQIEIWPEFDRPAALVILRGQVANGVALPADVSLRITASSGGPTAVAYAPEGKLNLFNLNFERTNAKDFITLRFKVPERFFQVEFYDRLEVSTSARNYNYVWPGDLAIDRLSILVQEPAAASNVSTQPNLSATAPGPEGLRYRSAELGAFEVGTQLPIEIRYTKTDSRTSAEIVGIKVPQSSSDAIPGSSDRSSVWLMVLAVTAVLVGALAAASLWWRRKNPMRTDGARFCATCGAGVGANDRYCAKCGRPLG